jgi:ribosomal protein S18 acetylase RimI-like enzyme
MMVGYYTEDGYAFSAAAAESSFLKVIAEPGLGQVYIFEIDAVVIGYLVLTFGFSFEYRGRDAFIDELFIKPEYRGQGIGSSALDFAEDECKKAGVNALHLEVERDKVRTIELYRRHGFANNDRFLMTKWLAKPS